MTGHPTALRLISLCRGFLTATLLLALAPLAPVQADGAGAATAPHRMVAAADPRAVEAGLAILRAGGDAMDAAVAVQMVLGLVEPQSSGIGGGGFLLYYDRTSGKVTSYDGRETAPKAAPETLFLDESGAPMPFREAMVGGRAVGVPGLLRMLELAHREHGRLPWRDLFEPAIALAEQGFEVTPYLSEKIAAAPALDRYPETAAYFLTPDGHAKPPGTAIRNPAYAETLRAIAEGGADGFYDGPIARDIVAAVRGDPHNPGLMTEADLADYRAKQRAPVCMPYRVYVVCGMGPPSSGGIAVLQILGLLERFDVAALAPLSAEAVHLFAEAGRLALADRNRYIADPDFAAVPVDGLLNKAYLAGRAAAIRPDARMSDIAPGAPPGIRQYWLESDSWREPGSTTHFSIVDGEGNAVALTSSIEQNFGSRLMVRGFLLNQQLTDFDFRPEADGVPAANRVEGGKRPRSSMAPTLVFDRDGHLLIAVGSPGGPLIIPYVALTLLAALDWNLDMQAAVALPRYAFWRDEIELEEGTALADIVPALEALGEKVALVPFNSGLYGIRVRAFGLEGGADPRKPGIALGD